MRRIAIAVAAVGVALVLGVMAWPSFAQVSSTYVRRAGDFMSGTLRFLNASDTDAVRFENSGARLHFSRAGASDYLYGNGGTQVVAANDVVVIGNQYVRTAIANDEGTEAVTINDAQGVNITGVASGSNALVVADGNRIDFGTGATDYIDSTTNYVRFGSDVIIPGTVLVRGSFANDTASTSVTVNDAEGFRLVGVATGSLASCVAGLAGTTQYDTTTNTLKYCNGTAWVEPKTATYPTSQHSFAGYSQRNDYVEGDAWGYSRSALNATASEMYVNVLVAGTGAGNAIVRWLQGGVQACISTFACTTAAGATGRSDSGCSGAITTGEDLVLHWAAESACTLLPIVVVNAVSTVP